MQRQSRTRVPTIALLVALCTLATLVVACGKGGSSKVQTPVPASQPTFAHVVLVVEENHSFEGVIGNSDMPYLNSLSQQYGLAAKSYANFHPSLPNYFMLTTGQPETVVNTFSGLVDDDNVVRELNKAGKSWKVYAESIPAPGYTGPDVYPYLRHHNPFAYLSDTRGNTPAAANVVSFSQFAADLGNNALPQYSFIIPNVLDDSHNGSLQQADAWLQQNIAPLIASPAFQSSGLLIITYDEGDQSDVAHGGGHIATVIVSSKSKQNYVSQTVFSHPSTLRLTLAASGVNSFPGAAAIAPDLTDFFSAP